MKAISIVVMLVACIMSEAGQRSDYDPTPDNTTETILTDISDVSQDDLDAELDLLIDIIK